jgi:transposase-like protein
MSERMAPFHCPYCGDENLRPHEATHGTWECHSCLRAFSVKFLGQLRASSAGTVEPVDPAGTAS